MIKIYHNPRCSKSREGLAVLENSNRDFEIVKYLEKPMTEKELTEIVKLLGIPAIDLVRKNEKIWKEEFKGKVISEEAVIKAMVANPKLIERPIIVNGSKAVIGRPSSNIQSII
ncbi:arsenate reductase (glutaredoxin) [Cellulophaga sp. HaHa_2_95]|uniref:arsenate reductase (glutaredoxin) n=1 Tax=unclassified Cellulophaga TaxID=2634405 RepID=UPI001C4FDBD5|nr:MULTISPECIES: arsenate reductase (glutaredoxin) [unclassified Cellulophaga]QXP52718.1 arsenate reductase (glutaredoxin) [Cellulophaga sp. HaHa_2_1]QXP54999.1 arsenate reductase (glutaredoxin) [Cellulophaga sp. HaHa_2_95]